jgi:hypothetical protein
MPRLLDIRDEEGCFYIVIVSQSTVANGILVVVLWLSWRDYCASTNIRAPFGWGSRAGEWSHVG